MLELLDIHKSYEGALLLRGVSFSVAAGETVCLLGPSGSGKSTLLRISAGLETAEQGDVRWDGQSFLSMPPHLRRFGLMFQDYALFPHLNVAENTAFGLRMQNISAREIKQRVDEVLKQVNLAGFESRRVTDLSGGEQQRVALARTLAPRPRLLMFDEPLGALDRALREHLLAELRGILHATGVPALYVTHDQEEAFMLADKVILLHEGGIVQSGSPAQVFANPRSVWVVDFLGLGMVLAGRVASGGGVVETAAGKIKPMNIGEHAPGSLVRVLVRPGGAVIESEDGVNVIAGVVADIAFRNESFRVTLDNGLYFDLRDAPRLGARVKIRVPSSAIQCLP
jgi:ABC-type Fe3+/spermidine/putrescine transport system ATPase subunit